ncbi:MAG: 2-C-methyl-D-erythritol 2,4-cyclodiphosphate synthase [bacterium]
MVRVGIGYDVHKLVKGRKLMLGGVAIPYAKGLLGHSDADVVIHAICDALLGAAALGDIGMHFPNTDPNYKNIESLKLLGKVGELIRSKRYRIGNIDSTLIAEEPRIGPYIKRMQKKIADALYIEDDFVSVKATTNERLGFIGQKKGIAAYAICLIEV